MASSRPQALLNPIDEANDYYKKSDVWEEHKTRPYDVWLRDAKFVRDGERHDRGELVPLLKKIQDENMDTANKIDNVRKTINPQDPSSEQRTITALKVLHKNDAGLLVQTLEKLGIGNGNKAAQDSLKEASQSLLLQQREIVAISLELASLEHTATSLNDEDNALGQYLRMCLDQEPSEHFITDMKLIVDHVQRAWYSCIHADSIRSWLSWDPDNKIYPGQEFIRPRDAQDLLLLSHADVSQIKYAGLHNIARQLIFADKRQTLVAACTIEAALENVLQRAPCDDETVFFCYRCVELLVCLSQIKTNQLEQNRARDLLVRSKMRVKTGSVLNIALERFIEAKFAAKPAKDLGQYIETVAREKLGLFPQEVQGKVIWISDGESVLQLDTTSQNSTVERCSKHEVDMTIDDRLRIWVNMPIFDVKIQVPRFWQVWYRSHFKSAAERLLAAEMEG